MNQEIIRSDGSDGRQPGAFVSGTGRPRGTRNKITKALLSEAEAEMAKGGLEANPLTLLMRVYMNESVPWHVRVMAADRFLARVMPDVHEVGLEDKRPLFNVEKQQARIFAANPEIRLLFEKIVERAAITAGDPLQGADLVCLPEYQDSVGHEP
jgi:hypothetical protein